jgi:thiol-disulfide isomerase/thioredoxin
MMANTPNVIGKRQRRRLKAEQERAAQRRRDQRRTIGYTLGALAVVVIAVAVITGAGGSSGTGRIQPSTSGEISISAPPRSSMLAEGATIPSFSAPGFHMAPNNGRYALERDRFDWSRYEGAPTVLAIWAPWCPHCQAELPVLSSTVAEYRSVQLASVVTAIGQHPGPSPDEYLTDHRLTFPAAIDDESGTLARALGVQAFPTLYLVGSDGKIALAAEGEVPAETLKEELSSLS